MTTEAETNSQLIHAVRTAADYLDNIAETADGWAAESKTGGWSTHQVRANRSLADDCRRRAAELRRLVK